MQEDERTGHLPAQNQTVVERKAALELTATRAFDAPIHAVYEAWTKPDLFRRWWTPKSSGMSLLSCEMDARVGGGYRLVFGHPASGTPMTFYGSYREVKPDSRLVWTNEESPEGAVTTVTFEEKDGRTLLVLRELHISNQALEESLADMQGALPEQFAQLDQLLAGQP